MKFFIPAAADDEQAESVYNSIKKFASETTGWKIEDKRIFNIAYYHDGNKYYAEVGKVEDLISDLVIAILELAISRLYGDYVLNWLSE